MINEQTISEIVYGMKKQADASFNPFRWATSAAGTGVDLMATTAVAMLSAAAALGLGGGWAMSQITAAGKNDIANAKTEYENERLTADLSYLKAKSMKEWQDFNKGLNASPKPARVL